MRTTHFASVVLLLTACSQPPDNGVDGGSVDDAAVVTSDVGYVDSGPSGPPATPHDGGYADGGPAMAFTGANETWQAVAVDGASCGNGSPLMIAVNLTTRSNDVVVYFQGGGACWDGESCFHLGTATHVTDTLTASVVMNEATGGTSFLFQRDAMNPFQNASYVYIPYCTGDAHAGANVAMLTDPTTHMPRAMHFEGAHNTELVLARMAATRPTTTHVFLIGASAGGYGVMANWWRAQQIFSGARVDAISDSGLPLNVPLSRWHTYSDVWAFDFPPDCTTCSNIGDAVGYYAQHMPPPHRFGLLAFLDDTTIPGFYFTSVQSIHSGLLALRQQTETTPNMHTFYVNMSDHVLMQYPDTLTAGAGGPTVRQWITQLATDDPAWTDVGP